MIKRPDLQAVAFKVQIYTVIWDTLPFGSDGKESACNVEDVGLIPGLGILWRRAWQPTPVFLPGELPWTEEPEGLRSIGSQRVRHDFTTTEQQQPFF